MLLIAVAQVVFASVHALRRGGRMMHRAGGTLVALALLAAPAAALAQETGRHELGVDAALAWVKPSGVDGRLTLWTPVDVRLGLPSSGPVSLEPRLSLFLQSDGGTRYSIDPGLNVLYRLGGTAPNENRYLTFGADLDLEKIGPSGAILALNGGYGMRHPWGTGAFRTEFFFRYAFEDTALGVPNTLTLGVRAGISLWH
jgi:hypothetical protein